MQMYKEHLHISVTDNLIESWKLILTKMSIHVANKYMKKDSTAMKYHYTPIEMAKNLKDGQ